MIWGAFVVSAAARRATAIWLAPPLPKASRHRGRARATRAVPGPPQPAAWFALRDPAPSPAPSKASPSRLAAWLSAMTPSPAFMAAPPISRSSTATLLGGRFRFEEGRGLVFGLFCFKRWFRFGGAGRWASPSCQSRACKGEAVGRERSRPRVSGPINRSSRAGLSAEDACGGSGTVLFRHPRCSPQLPHARPTGAPQPPGGRARPPNPALQTPPPQCVCRAPQL